VLSLYSKALRISALVTSHHCLQQQ